MKKEQNSNNEETQALNIPVVMQRALDAYKYIDEYGGKLGKVYEGDVIFIEYNMLFARINRLMREHVA